MNQIIIQGIGYLALAFVLLSFQKNKRVNILLIMLAGLLLFVIHFSLLNAWTGAVMNLIEALIVLVAYKKETATWAQHKIWPYIFIVLYIAAGIFTGKAWTDSLPIIAQIFGALAVWQIHPRKIRFLMLIPRPLWFIYNFIVGSQAGMVAEMCILVSVVIGIIRFDLLKEREEVSTQKD